MRHMPTFAFIALFNEIMELSQIILNHTPTNFLADLKQQKFESETLRKWNVKY